MSVLLGLTGTEKFARFRTLKNSARNCTLKLSEIRLIGLFLNREKSRFDVPGPVRMLRPALPRRLKHCGKGTPVVQILPEEWLIERIQQVGATPHKLLSPSFSTIIVPFAALFRNLRYVFVTVSGSGTTAVVISSPASRRCRLQAACQRKRYCACGRRGGCRPPKSRVAICS